MTKTGKTKIKLNNYNDKDKEWPKKQGSKNGNEKNEPTSGEVQGRRQRLRKNIQKFS